MAKMTGSATFKLNLNHGVIFGAAAAARAAGQSKANELGISIDVADAVISEVIGELLRYPDAVVLDFD